MWGVHACGACINSYEYPIFARRITEPVTRKNGSFHVEGNIPLSEAILVLMSGTVPVPYIYRIYRLLFVAHERTVCY